MFQFISVMLQVQVLVRSAMNQYSFYNSFSLLEYSRSSFSKRLTIILVLVFVLVTKIALVVGCTL